ncbi:MAG TPA: hypothetical protein DCQ50_15805 [Chryseobacterium sp.]|nr:hypothetical protein [Chryseobacterium sp.]
MAIEIEITWQEPQHYFYLKNTELPPNNGFLYKEVSYSRNKFTLLSIGHSFAKKVDLTNNNRHFQEPLLNFRSSHPNRLYLISIGIIDSPIKLTKAQLIELETLEVMAHPRSKFPHLINNKFLHKYSMPNYYTVYNSGFKLDKMVSKITYDFEVFP